MSGRQEPVSARRKRAPTQMTGRSMNPTLNLRAIKCYYQDCITPADPNTLPPLTESPASVPWSLPSSWNHTNNTLPVNGDDVEIPKGWKVLQ